MLWYDAVPSYISELFTERSSNISLWGRQRLVIPSVDTWQLLNEVE